MTNRNIYAELDQRICAWLLIPTDIISKFSGTSIKTKTWQLSKQSQSNLVSVTKLVRYDEIYILTQFIRLPFPYRRRVPNTGMRPRSSVD